MIKKHSVLLKRVFVVLIAALLGIVFFHEVLTPFKLLGMAAILFSIVLLNSKSSQ